MSVLTEVASCATNVGMQGKSLRYLFQERDLTLSLVSEQMHVCKSTVSRWVGNRVPAERVVELEAVTGISRHLIRPDLYPPAVSLNSHDPSPRKFTEVTQ